MRYFKSFDVMFVFVREIDASLGVTSQWLQRDGLRLQRDEPPRVEGPAPNKAKCPAAECPSNRRRMHAVSPPMRAPLAH
jgi:hypothetical protein